MKNSLPEITIVRDTREKMGWDFPYEEKIAGKIRILGTVDEYIEEGDYTIKGAEDLIRIERKMGFGELFGNMIPRDHKERFEREIERLSNIRHKYIIIENNLSNDILGLSVAQFSKGPPCSSIVRWLIDLQINHDINIIFAGDAGKKVAKMIFDSIARRYL